ncbi:hypothetical protein GCM10009117_20500 [Gangjinia marincola]|uniref:Uncharacterized protein n=1 Tax=Gangjinia marincola TaxID=578463 RepID=A0ABN1MIA3_9FLAO
MKIFTYILIGVAAALMIYNLTLVNYTDFFAEDSKIALIGVISCLCAIVLMTILLVSKKIAAKSKGR